MGKHFNCSSSAAGSEAIGFLEYVNLTPKPGASPLTRDIYPVLARLSGLQWLNAALRLTGCGRPSDFANQDLIADWRESGQSDIHANLRREIFNA